MSLHYTLSLDLPRWLSVKVRWLKLFLSFCYLYQNVKILFWFAANILWSKYNLCSALRPGSSTKDSLPSLWRDIHPVTKKNKNLHHSDTDCQEFDVFAWKHTAQGITLCGEKCILSLQIAHTARFSLSLSTRHYVDQRAVCYLWLSVYVFTEKAGSHGASGPANTSPGLSWPGFMSLSTQQNFSQPP